MALRRVRKSEAKKAIESAQCALGEVKAQSEEVDELVGDLVRIREENHFSERLLAAFELRKAEGAA